MVVSNTELQPNLRCPSVEVLEALNWLSEQGRCTYGSVAEVVHNDRYPVSMPFGQNAPNTMNTIGLNGCHVKGVPYEGGFPGS